MKTAKVTLFTKDPDEWGNCISALGLTERIRQEHFEFGEYATIELEIGEDMRVVSGRIVPLAEARRR